MTSKILFPSFPMPTQSTEPSMLNRPLCNSSMKSPVRKKVGKFQTLSPDAVQQCVFCLSTGFCLRVLCGHPQWGSLAQMWAAEASPKGWLSVGPVPSSNLELPGGCEAAFSVPFSFPHICLALQGFAPQRYLSSSLLDISVSYVSTQKIDSKHLLQIQAWDFESLIYHVSMMTELKRALL